MKIMKIEDEMSHERRRRKSWFVIIYQHNRNENEYADHCQVGRHM
jgi:hypothetical protein